MGGTGGQWRLELLFAKSPHFRFVTVSVFQIKKYDEFFAKNQVKNIDEFLFFSHTNFELVYSI